MHHVAAVILTAAALPSEYFISGTKIGLTDAPQMYPFGLVLQCKNGEAPTEVECVIKSWQPEVPSISHISGNTYYCEALWLRGLSVRSLDGRPLSLLVHFASVL